MAKSSNTSTSDRKVTSDEDTQVVIESVPSKFRRLGAVSVPTLKVEDGDKVHFYVRAPFAEKMVKNKETVKDPITGQETIQYRDAMLEILPIVNLETGQIMQMVGNAVLVKELKGYNGGNQNYVGKSFEITKKAAKPGSRAKLFEIYEIETPADVSEL